MPSLLVSQGNVYQHHQQHTYHHNQQQHPIQSGYPSSESSNSNTNGNTVVTTTATSVAMLTSTGIGGGYEGVNYAPQPEDRIKLEPRVY